MEQPIAANLNRFFGRRAFLTVCALLCLRGGAAAQPGCQPILFLGDSITHGVGASAPARMGFPARVGDILSCPVRKRAVGGALMDSTRARKRTQKAGCFVEAIVTSRAEITAGWRLVVAYGTNDLSRGTPVGNPTDRRRGSFHGAMREGVETARAMNPLVDITFITPIYRRGEDNQNNSLGRRLEDYRNAIRIFAREFQIPVIEGRDLGIGPENAGAYLRDGIHPNDAGYVRIAQRLAAELALSRRQGE